MNFKSITRSQDFDAVVVGAGPNGLSAAIRLRQAGLTVLVLEAKPTLGGGARSAELTLPGFTHDVCSAIHPLAMDSPFFSSLPLREHGLEFITPDVAAAHPLEGGGAAALMTSPALTARSLGEDEQKYLSLIKPMVESWPGLCADILDPLSWPRSPLAFARFGIKAITSSRYLSKVFATREARALLAGMAAHSMLPLSTLTTSAIALVLLVTGHTTGWPIARGGSQRIADALSSYFLSLGGVIETNFLVRSMKDLPASRVVLFDVTPRQLLSIAGEKFSAFYRWQLGRYRYGMGVFKVDWALDGPVPFTDETCLRAGTVHLGNTFEEIASGEQSIWSGKIPERPFVLFAQQSKFDTSRAPVGKHTAWAYCHVPAGSSFDMTGRIEDQVERFAPGFRDLILGRHTFNAAEIEAYNPNYIGGDINGGVSDIWQIFARPALRLSPYRTSAKGIYICSSSTPPGGGVHGMCGLHAAEQALKDEFGVSV